MSESDSFSIESMSTMLGAVIAPLSAVHRFIVHVRLRLNWRFVALTGGGVIASVFQFQPTPEWSNDCHPGFVSPVEITRILRAR